MSVSDIVAFCSYPDGVLKLSFQRAVLRFIYSISAKFTPFRKESLLDGGSLRFGAVS